MTGGTPGEVTVVMGLFIGMVGCPFHTQYFQNSVLTSQHWKPGGSPTQFVGGGGGGGGSLTNPNPNKS